jgi:hypothetical protein
MNFGFSTTGGGGEDFLPLFTYSAKSGRFGTKDTVENNGEYTKQEAELRDDDVQFVADIPNIQQGWLLFKKGVAPIKAMVPIGTPLLPRPAGHGERDEKGREIFPKEGFVLHVMLKDGVVREFASNAKACLGGVAEMLSAFSAAPERASGKLPVLKLKRTYKADKNGNYAPEFEIAKWVDRPAKMNGSAPAAAHAYTPPPPPPPVKVTADDEVPF